MKQHENHLQVALDEAISSVTEGGMPFGAALVIDGQVVAKARNRQLQDNAYFSHAETNCLMPFLTRPLSNDTDAVLYASEAPCPMCAGAALISGIRKVVVGENQHYAGAIDWLRQEGIEVVVLDDPACIQLVTDFKQNHPEKWNRYSAG